MKTDISSIKNPENGYVINSYIKYRDDGSDHLPYLFRQQQKYRIDILTAHLDGYAIIPIEEYERLKGNEVINLSDAIKAVNNQ
jgi:hypothetical protein